MKLLLGDLQRSPWLSKWQREVGPLSARSARLVLALCAAFAAPLFAMARARPFLVHLYGPRAEGGDPAGRELALRLASCVYGRDALHSSSWDFLARHPMAAHDETEDGLLLLSNFDETLHGEVIAAAGARWFDRPGAGSKLDLRRDRVGLSCGSLAIDPALLRQANGPGKAWVINVPTDALAGDGMFEIASSLEDRVALDNCAADCAGWIGLHWLAHVNRHGRAIADSWEAEGDFGEARALDPTTRLTAIELLTMFARMATAGEEATAAGLTGWAPGTAKAALWKCFVDMVQADSRRAGRPPDAPGTLALHLVTRKVD